MPVPGIADLQAGQSDLELASADCAVLLKPAGSSILTDLEDKTTGSIDRTKINRAAGFISTGNWTKKGGVRLSNSPTTNKIMSHGKGGPTAILASEAEKSIRYSPQELNLINLKLAWGFSDDMVSKVSPKGGFTIQLPELPKDLKFQAVLLSWTAYQGLDIFKYWIFNKAIVDKREDINLVDSNVIEHGVTLTAQTHPALPGVPVVFGMCGPGLAALAANVADGSLYLPATGITSDTTVTVTAAAGASNTKQLSIKDSNGIDRTATATYVSDTPAKATVSATGLVTGVMAGSAKVTATYGAFTAVTNVTVS